MTAKLKKQERLVQLNELKELRNRAYENAIIYKDKTKRWNDQKILRKGFKVGESVISVTLFGVVTLKSNSGKEFKVNGQRLKHYFGGIMNKEQSSG